MKIIYGKQLNEEQLSVVKEISLQCDISFDIARLLYCRNIDTIQKAKRFLNPGKQWFYDPFLLNGVKRAVERINKAKEQNEQVVIFGDYDADGVCAVTVLRNCLEQFGLTKIITHVPERVEGYGLNIETIDNICAENKINLIITVDCGISDYERIEVIEQRGIDVIVTDHHEPPEILPNCITINPKISGQAYPFDGLCGAGVAYKLGYALIGEKADVYLDYVALATVADSMELVDENRNIVAEGLKLYNNPSTLRLSMKHLLGDNATKAITSQTLAYNIAPRINAGGRMGDANCALELFASTNPEQIYNLAVQLHTYNIQRQVECDDIYKKAKLKIQKYSLNKNSVILVKDKNWQTGFVGIVAARLVEEFAKPVIVFAGQEDFLKGSARSVDGVNIHEAITANKEYLLGFGGHSQAAGVSVSPENFVNFDKAINEYVAKNCTAENFVRTIYVDQKIERELDKKFVKELELLEPFGVGNRNPLFSTTANKVKAMPLKEGSPHYSFNTNTLEMIYFNAGKDVAKLALPIDKEIVFELNVYKYKAKEYVKGYVKHVCLDFSNLFALELNAFNLQLESLLREEGEYKVVNKNNLPVSQGSGTLYVLSDAGNARFYPQLKNLPISFSQPESKNNADEIVFAPSVIFDGYDKIIYLDKPMCVQKTTARNYVVKDLIGYKVLDKIRTDREFFAQAFMHLKTLKGKSFFDVVDFININCAHFEKEALLFALKVFMELKIFYQHGQTFEYDEKITSALTNSKIYSKIVVLKDSYV